MHWKELRRMVGDPSVCTHQQFFNSLPNNNCFELNQIQSICRRQTNVVKILISASERVENVVGKGEIAGYHNVFKSFFLRVVKSLDRVVKS